MKRIAACAGLVALAACSTSRPARDIAFSYNGVTRDSVYVEQGHLHGMGVDVRLREDEYRGSWNGRLVALEAKGGHVLGSIGTTAIDVHVKDENGTLAVTGSVGGVPSALELTDDQLTGQFSYCPYELKKSDIGYDGTRCGNVATLKLPEGWGELSATERGTVLALILAST